MKCECAHLLQDLWNQAETGYKHARRHGGGLNQCSSKTRNWIIGTSAETTQALGDSTHRPAHLTFKPQPHFVPLCINNRAPRSHTSAPVSLWSTSHAIRKNWFINSAFKGERNFCPITTSLKWRTHIWSNLSVCVLVYLPSPRTSGDAFRPFDDARFSHHWHLRMSNSTGPKLEIPFETCDFHFTSDALDVKLEGFSLSNLWASFTQSRRVPITSTADLHATGAALFSKGTRLMFLFCFLC